MEEEKVVDEFSDLAHLLRRLSKKVSRCLGCINDMSGDPTEMLAVVRDIAVEALEVFESASDYVDGVTVEDTNKDIE